MTRVRVASLLAVLVVVGWIRTLPLGLEGVERGVTFTVRNAIATEVDAFAAEHPAAAVDAWIGRNRGDYEQRLARERAKRRDLYTFDGDDGRRHVFLGGYDSYMWLRAARNWIETGTGCDSIVNGQCRDDFTLAPVGVQGRYAHLLPVSVIGATHQVLSLFNEGQPLSASAYFVSWLLGTITVVPAFFLGCRFGGTVGGVLAAVLTALNTTFLMRSFGADNDVWNVALPVFQMWAAVEAIYAERNAKRWFFLLFAVTATLLHRATWSGWTLSAVAIVIGLWGNAAIHWSRRLLYGGDDDDRARAWQSLVVAVAYFAVTSVGMTMFGGEGSPGEAASNFARRLTGIVMMARSELAKVDAKARQQAGEVEEATDDGVEHVRWPNLFRTVGELRKPGLMTIAHSASGPVYFFVSWLGMILLILPRQGWQSWHFAVLIAGNLYYRYLMTRTDLSSWILVIILLLPLSIGVGAYLADRDQPVEDQGAGVMLIVWFLAGLFLAYNGRRFLMLLAPPLAVLCAVSVGRLHAWVLRQPVVATAPGWTRAVVFAALVATAWPPVSRAIDVSESYLPLIDQSWFGTLDRIRRESPRDTIVNTWWDYGYFTKYFADRRVLSDGGTLRTHVHHWFARAFLATDEREGLGILRMLNCGSDAIPESEGSLGAMGLLQGSGVQEARAYRTIIAIAPLERAQAEAYLRDEVGLSREQVEKVLERTHCRPAPAYLVLPENMVLVSGFVDIGRGLLEGSASARTRRALTSGWTSCRGKGPVTCALQREIPRIGFVREIRIDLADPAASQLVVRNRDGAEESVALAMVVTAQGERVDRWRGDGEWGVYFESSGRRALVAAPELLDSLLARLLLPSPDPPAHFEAFERRVGQRSPLRSWRIIW